MLWECFKQAEGKIVPRKNPNELLNLLRAKLAQQYRKTSKTYAEKLVDGWVEEAVVDGRSPRKLAAIEGIVVT